MERGYPNPPIQLEPSTEDTDPNGMSWWLFKAICSVKTKRPTGTSNPLRCQLNNRCSGWITDITNHGSGWGTDIAIHLPAESLQGNPTDREVTPPSNSASGPIKVPVDGVWLSQPTDSTGAKRRRLMNQKGKECLRVSKLSLPSGQGDRPGHQTR